MEMIFLDDDRLKEISCIYAKGLGKTILKEFADSNNNLNDKKELASKIKSKVNAVHLISRTNLRRAFRHASVAVLTVAISVGAVFSFSEDARAMVKNWYMETVGNRVLYHFEGENNGEILKKPVIGWIPEGFERTDVIEMDGIYDLTYRDENDTALGISFYRIGIIDTSEIIRTNDNYSKVEINGFEAEFYEAKDEGDGSILFWQDDTNNIICEIDSALEKEVIIKIAENISFN